MTRFTLAILMLALAGCAPGSSDPNYSKDGDPISTTPVPWPEETRTPTEQAKVDEESASAQRVDAIRKADPALNWISIGISTGKFSESMSSGVHKTYEQCVAHSYMSANECIPIAALPASYWNAKDPKRKAKP